MQENQIFEYAIIRVVPRVEREEFLNVGVVLYCPKQKFLEITFDLNETRLNAFADKIDIIEIREYLCGFRQICQGGDGAGPIGKLPIAERFRWLTATRSTIVQTSEVHSGLCTNPIEVLNRLHSQLVL